MTETCILAIDPGLTGAIAFYFPSEPGRVVVEDMPVVDGEVEPASLVRRIRQMAPTVAIVERVGPMPRDGAVQAFRFGSAYAAAKVAVALCEIPYHLVTPASWKKHFRLAGGPEGKEQSRALALQTFPRSSELFARKKDHGRAEAALLARYAAEKLIQPQQVAA
ncbi:RuvC family protein [Methylobacterium planeticum]|uniref:Uncharacterized protein n=1 Tax=Methylobacterium planeticum TaxID=2615211 RepID=A0A6N6MDT4_9HYPH|nr:hypothetical protein [Methylobacterium planeticum]KAB1068880.1 hypothetical protein F6X51_26110 [Methylobacterium planeticum]